MFICDICKTQTSPGEKMFKVPDQAVLFAGGPQIIHEAKLCPKDRARYEALLIGRNVNPQSAYAALLEEAG